MSNGLVLQSDLVAGLISAGLNSQRAFGYTRAPLRAGINSTVVAVASRILADKTSFKLMENAGLLNEEHMFAFLVSAVLRYLDGQTDLENVFYGAMRETVVQIAADYVFSATAMNDAPLV